MYDVACIKVIPHNTTACSLSNYIWIDGCLEHQGGCYAEFCTVLDGGIPFYFHHGPHEKLIIFDNKWCRKSPYFPIHQ